MVDKVDWAAARAVEFTPPVTIGDTEVGSKYEVFEFVNGRGFVHRAEQCDRDVTCAVHNPFNHGTRALPMLLRETTLIERVCPHGIGHPDPDSVAYFTRNGQEYMGIHGCDGCCSHTWLDATHIACYECGSPMVEVETDRIALRWTCTNFGGCELSVG